MTKNHLALSAIRKKLSGKDLNYKEIYAIMDEIASEKLGDVLTTYFAASGYSKGFSDQELYFLTKAMVETGDKLEFKGIVADKHSIGGLPGTRTTLIVVPIVAACGFTIPKSSSRAITTPGGTADDMETIAEVAFDIKGIYDIVKKTNGCIVWGGSVNIAPADDNIIKVEEPLLFESYDKILVSIMAKKIAFGSNHVVIDVPYGKSVKVQKLKEAELLKEKFEFLAKKFNIKLVCLIHRTDQPFGRGIGPILETREAIRVLQQKKSRPLDLEVRSLNLASTLLEICLEDSPHALQKEVKEKYGNAFGWATHILQSGQAFAKMQEIIKAQRGDPKLDSEDLKPGKHKAGISAKKSGKIKAINSKNATVITRILGAPGMKEAGIFFEKQIGDTVKKGELLYTMYTSREINLNEAKATVPNFPIIEY